MGFNGDCVVCIPDNPFVVIDVRCSIQHPAVTTERCEWTKVIDDWLMTICAPIKGG